MSFWTVPVVAVWLVALYRVVQKNWPLEEADRGLQAEQQFLQPEIGAAQIKRL